MSSFRESRNVERSLLYYLETNIALDWSGVSVLRSFKQAYSKDTDVPIITVELTDNNPVKREIGSTVYDGQYLCTVNIFAKSDGQRMDLTDYVKEKVESGWTHYTHSRESGDLESVTRTQNGRDSLLSFIDNSKITLSEIVDEKDKYRHKISFIVRTTET